MFCNRFVFLLAGVSALALTASAAMAQEAPAAQPQAAQASDTPSNIETVVVTGSLVVTNGFQAPTPVTVVSGVQLHDAAPSVVAGLQLLPQLGTSTSSLTPNLINGSGAATVSAENLRNLGTGRTLVLLDGRRTQPGGSGGYTDTSMFPDLLVQRVDIVTGGASAVYGSDAVAGVINFILDTDFVGFKSQAQGGVSGNADSPLYGVELAAGTTFAGGHGHVVVSADTSGESGLAGRARDWDNEGWSAFANPNTSPGQPQYLLRKGVSTINGLSTGIITSSPGLSGIAFDASGNPYQFPYASVISGNGAQEIGSSGLRLPSTISAGVNAEHVFANVKYDVNDRISLFVQGAYGYNSSVFSVAVPYFIANSSFTIFSGNAYLPASLQSQMTTQGINSFQLGKIWTDLGPILSTQLNSTIDLYAGGRVKLWNDWSWDTYVQHGSNLLTNTDGNLPIRYNLYKAVDAVVNPANGAITCNSTLTDPGNGCVPLDLFGSHPLSPAQRAYIIGQNRARSFTQQEVASTTVHGTVIPDWAGDITAAAGFTYRSEYASVRVDPTSTETIDCAAQGIRGCPPTIKGLTGGYTNVNIQPSAGRYDVKEAFGEVFVPLAKDLPYLESLDLDAAFRYAEYSASGDAETWKAGLTYQPLDEVRLRGSMSRDLRAPNVGELFGGTTFGVGTVTDPENNNQSVPNVFEYSGSNPNLKPETALTTTGGVVYNPNWLPNFGASVDYYHIAISGAIAALTAQQVVNACSEGYTAVCSQILRSPPTNTNPLGTITTIYATNLNLSQLKTSGVDFETNYTTPLYKGDLTFRLLGTYLANRVSYTPNAAPIFQAGSGSLPLWQGTLSAGYVQDQWSLILTERFIGGVHRETPPTTIDLNNTPDAEYTTLTMKYAFDGDDGWGKKELYFTVDNLFDQNPRITATNGGQGANYSVTTGLYDVIGRYFTVGVRASL